MDAEHDDPRKPKGHPYAADYPDCLKIIEEKVKPERENLNTNNSTQRRRAELWWQFGSRAPALYEAIDSLNDESGRMKDEKGRENSSFIPHHSSLEKILSPATTERIRAELETAILKDLLGSAAGAEEEIEARSVTDRYLVGLLAPQLRRKKGRNEAEASM